MKKSFRPAASHIKTIGSELIKDQYAAIIELVKNAYDADANNVWIRFHGEEKKIEITIKDDGHGMSTDDVEFKWLVPSTKDKLDRKTSPKKRVMQGRKGIGRFAASILGDFLRLRTVSENIETVLEIDWNVFGTVDYLDQISFELDSSVTNQSNGTIFNIIGGELYKKDWGVLELEYLRNELRKTLTYLPKDFSIHLDTRDFPIANPIPSNDILDPLEPLSLLDDYHYRISGSVNNNGTGILVYEYKNQTEDIPFEFIIPEDLKEEDLENCGTLVVDFRVFDRDKKILEQMAQTLELFDQKNKADYRLVAQMIDNISGVSVSRHGFNVRPYGEEGKDWLFLDRDRVQNPSLRVGFNQISGVIKIDSEEDSNLIEKSARDGLKENKSYKRLVLIAKQILSKLETKRFEQRRKESAYNFTQKIISSKELRSLVDYKKIKSTLELKFNEYNIDKTVLQEVQELLDEKSSKDQVIIDKIEDTIAEYQNQVTLGRMTNVLLHELNRPVGRLKNESDIIGNYLKSFEEDKNLEHIYSILDSSKNVIEESHYIEDTINRLKPFALKKRGSTKLFPIVDSIYKSINMYKNYLRDNKIGYEFKYDKEYKLVGWQQDFVMIVNNIIDNAIFWLSISKKDRTLTINVYSENDLIYIEFSNNGPLIPKNLLSNGLLFVPGISNKPNGTGLGLAIVGEATKRLSGSVKAMNDDHWVKFIIEIPMAGATDGSN